MLLRPLLVTYLFQINLPPQFCSPPQIKSLLLMSAIIEVEVLFFADTALFTMCYILLQKLFIRDISRVDKSKSVELL